MKGIDIALEIWKRKEKVFKNYKQIAKKIKSCAKKILRDKNVKVLVFGSVVKGNYNPLSDLDILIISEKCDKIKYGEFVNKIKKTIKKDLIGVEFHLATPKIFEKWYKRFIDEYYEI